MKTNPKETGVLFNTPMVRAINGDYKTMTRRIITPQPTLSDRSGFSWKGSAYGLGSDERGTQRNFMSSKANRLGNVGDLILVRERMSVIAFAASQEYHTEAGRDCDGGGCKVRYHADSKELNFIELGESQDGIDEEAQAYRMSKKKSVPSIHMPKWACRTWLEITDVKVERLQDISEYDAAREGLIELPASGRYVINQGDQYFGLAAYDPCEVFKWLWVSIYGNESWDANPWLFAYSFKKINKTA